MADAPVANTLSLEVAAQLLMLTPQRVNQLVRAGYIPKPARNQYPLGGLVQGYIKFLKDEERRTSKSAGQSKVQEQRAAEIAQRIARENRSLIDYAEAQGVLDDVVGIYRSELAGLPAACTMDLTARSAIEAQVDQTQARVEAALRERLAALRSGGGAVEAAGEDDA